MSRRSGRAQRVTLDHFGLPAGVSLGLTVADSASSASPHITPFLRAEETRDTHHNRAHTSERSEANDISKVVLHLIL